MRTKGLIYLIVLILAIIAICVTNLVNNLSGCNGDILERFERTDLAKKYQEAFLQQVLQGSDPSKVLNYRGSQWEINKSGDGCKVQIRATLYVLKFYYYYGDEFFINLKEEKVYPLGEGSFVFLDYYGGSVPLPPK